MDRKKIWVGLVILMVSVFFILWAGNPQAFAQAKPAKVFQWKIQSAWPPPEKFMGYWSGFGQTAEIVRRVKERTQGGLDIKPFPPDALFKVLEAPDALKRGGIEMLCSSGPYHVNILPESLLEWGLPYGTKSSQETAKIILESEFLSVLRKAYAEKHNAYLVGLGCATFAYRHLVPAEAWLVSVRMGRLVCEKLSNVTPSAANESRIEA